MFVFLSIVIVIVLVLLWLMIYRYTEHYRALKEEFKRIMKENNIKDDNITVKWGDMPKYEKTGKWIPVSSQNVSSQPKLSANEPQLLLGGLSYMEARKAAQIEQCEIMNQIGIKSVEEYQQWYEENKDEDWFEGTLRVVSGCVQERIFAGDERMAKEEKKEKLEDLVRF